jgi:phosphoenolpyruvate synthase/pyruvate phosphate dikinase
MNQLPKPPAGVRYALTVPQSVLFADISLRGSRAPYLHAIFGGDFQFDYIAIDDGAMSWNYTGDADFAKSFLLADAPAVGARRFISGMGTTSRAVERTSWLVSSRATRRPANVDDVLEDLGAYWDCYELHMTSLFTFWNVEELLSSALILQLRAVGQDDEINSGLQRFLQPNETNYFTLERRRLHRLAARMGRPAEHDGAALDEALSQHVDDFGFLLSPFNLGGRPSVASLLERLEDLPASDRYGGRLVDVERDLLLDLPEPVRELGLLAQELAFWKTERLDVMALGDARVADLYDAAATALSIDTDALFAMTRDEIVASLKQGSPVVDQATRDDRRRGFCLLLANDRIGFYLPSREASSETTTRPELTGELVGMPASSGAVTGRVRVIESLDDVSELEVGDVLVTAMTRPEMGVALDRASAFVTDEGGRMCHAAIIAREMQKPCVIGTGDATRRLKTGMLVTVSGDDGTVTICDGDNAPPSSPA